MLATIVNGRKEGVSVLIYYGQHLKDQAFRAHALRARPGFSVQSEFVETLWHIFSKRRHEGELIEKSSQISNESGWKRVHPNKT